MGKRKASLTSLSPTAANRPWSDDTAGKFINIKSIRDLAEPYRLTTARMPLNALTSTWRIGSNRRLDSKHVQALHQIFEKQGLQREHPDNHLLVTCSKAEFERMLACDATASTAKWPAFDDWMVVNDRPAEILSGQHRIEALRAFLHGKPAVEEQQSWWICAIFDQDLLPAELRVQLRANRLGSTLPDSHGQIWMELAILASENNSLFQGQQQGSVQEEMLAALQLSSGRVKFPIRRLVTLWKNNSWQPLITRWCRTSLGRATFNVSLWEELARYRIDDFWFDIFELVLAGISKLGSDASDLIQVADWHLLALLPSARSDADVRRLFYPDVTAADLEVIDPSLRHPKFLATATNAQYHQIYQNLLANPTLCLPDFQAVLRVGRSQTKTLSQVVNHIVYWLNDAPTSVGERDPNKPQLWRDLCLAFDGDESQCSQQARHLQRQVFDVVSTRASELTSAQLSTLPQASGDAYLDRFRYPIWRDLLLVVRQTVEGRFQGSLVRFNSEDLTSLSAHPKSTLVEDFIAAIPYISGVSCNPAALEDLKAEISPIVLRWAAQQRQLSDTAEQLLCAPPVAECSTEQATEGATTPLEVSLVGSSFTSITSLLLTDTELEKLKRLHRRNHPAKETASSSKNTPRASQEKKQQTSWNSQNALPSLTQATGFVLSRNNKVPSWQSSPAAR